MGKKALDVENRTENCIQKVNEEAINRVMRRPWNISNMYAEKELITGKDRGIDSLIKVNRIREKGCEDAKNRKENGVRIKGTNNVQIVSCHSV